MRTIDLCQSPIGVFGALIVGSLLVSGVAFAAHNEPEKAKRFESNLVRAYAPCVLFNTVTDSFPPLPACTPSVPLDGVCGISATEGRGKVKFLVVPGDIRVKVVVKNLTGCDGETLNLVLSTRLTQDNCLGIGADCTIADAIDIPIGSCIVSNGKCKIDSTVNTFTTGFLGFPIVFPGINDGGEILGCGLVRVTGAGAPARTLSCGLLVK